MKQPTCTFSYGGLRPPYNVHVVFRCAHFRMAGYAYHTICTSSFSFIPQGNGKKINNQFLNAITPNNCFVKGSHKYDIILPRKIKHITTDQIKTVLRFWFNATRCSAQMTSKKVNVLLRRLTSLLWSVI